MPQHLNNVNICSMQYMACSFDSEYFCMQYIVRSYINGLFVDNGWVTILLQTNSAPIDLVSIYLFEPEENISIHDLYCEIVRTIFFQK